MNLTLSFSRLIVSALAMVLCFAANSVAQSGGHIVKLKDGTVYRCDRYETTPTRITIFNAQRQQAMGSRPLTLQGPRDAGSTVDRNSGAQGPTLNFDWRELADESIEKYFPRRWTELQRQRNPAPAPAPAPQPAQPLQLRMPQPTQPAIAPPAPTPQPPVVAAPAPAPTPVSTAAAVKDRLNHIALRPLTLAKRDDDFLAQLEVANISARKLYDARATIYTADFELADSAEVAPLLAPDHQFAATFRLHLARAAERDDLLLTVKCYESPAEVEGRKAVFYNFRIQRQPSGAFVLNAAE
jgi:hypothetical protein